MSILDPFNLAKSHIPHIDLPAMIKVDSGKLQKGFLASKAVTDSVKLSITPDSFEMIANGKIERVILNLQKKDLIEHDSITLQQSRYSVDYLNEITKKFPAGNTVKILMGENQPLQMEYVFAEGNGYLTYMQAPRIEDESHDSSDEPLLPADKDSVNC